jgi:hypothetical protein
MTIYELTQTYHPLPEREWRPENDQHANEDSEPRSARFEKRFFRTFGVEHGVEDQAVERKGQNKGGARV